MLLAALFCVICLTSTVDAKGKKNKNMDDDETIVFQRVPGQPNTLWHPDIGFIRRENTGPHQGNNNLPQGNTNTGNSRPLEPIIPLTAPPTDPPMQTTPDSPDPPTKEVSSDPDKPLSSANEEESPQFQAEADTGSGASAGVIVVIILGCVCAIALGGWYIRGQRNGDFDDDVDGMGKWAGGSTPENLITNDVMSNGGFSGAGAVSQSGSPYDFPSSSEVSAAQKAPPCGWISAGQEEAIPPPMPQQSAAFWGNEQEAQPPAMDVQPRSNSSFWGNAKAAASKASFWS